MLPQQVTVSSAAGTSASALRHTWALAVNLQQALHASSLRVDTGWLPQKHLGFAVGISQAPPRHVKHKPTALLSMQQMTVPPKARQT